MVMGHLLLTVINLMEEKSDESNLEHSHQQTLKQKHPDQDLDWSDCQSWREITKLLSELGQSKV